MSALAERGVAAACWLRQTRDLPVARDVALLAARIGLAWIFVDHGARTLFGAFGGPGVHKASTFFSSVAHLHPGVLFATLSGVIELFGAIAVGLGLFGRLGAAGLTIDMVMAMATVTFRNGLISDAAGGGYELTLALAALAFVVAILGTGAWSLDAAIRRLGASSRPARPAAAGRPRIVRSG